MLVAGTATLCLAVTAIGAGTPARPHAISGTAGTLMPG